MESYFMDGDAMYMSDNKTAPYHIVPEGNLQFMFQTLTWFDHLDPEKQEQEKERLKDYLWAMRGGFTLLVKGYHGYTEKSWFPIIPKTVHHRRHALCVIRGFTLEDGDRVSYYSLGSFDKDGHLTLFGHNAGDKHFCPTEYKLFRTE